MNILCLILFPKMSWLFVAEIQMPSFKSGHSAMTLQINSFEDTIIKWHFNSSLLDDNYYIGLISSSYEDWLIEFQDIGDKRLLWDLIK